jgi:hypothetical protein
MEADVDDAWLLTGMNRLQHAYLELVPDLERYPVIRRQRLVVLR